MREIMRSNDPTIIALAEVVLSVKPTITLAFSFAPKAPDKLIVNVPVDPSVIELAPASDHSAESLSAIVILATVVVPRLICGSLAASTLVSVTVTVSLPSTRASSVTGTTIVAVVFPAVIVT